ncbi:unnamed protein product [Euphydryas editha]|uniref:Uncharacterized protein n=1 Tax=Euphydryas editha TaxID=104508 RepID=A0AAU9UUG1_EUPED|nr:unnamed protein product [Euphydryas editha]
MADKSNKTPEDKKIKEDYKKNQNKKKTGSAATVSKYDDELKLINESFEESECISSLNAENVLEVHEEDNLKIEKYSEPSTSSTQMSTCEPFLKQTSQEGHSIATNPTQGTSQVKKEKRVSLGEEFRKNGEERTKILGQISEQGNTPVHVFFRSMADVVCQFPPDKMAQIRKQVCNIVTEMELLILAQRGTSSPQDSEHSLNIPQQPMHPNNSQRQIPSPQHSLNIPQQPMNSNNSQRQIPSPQRSLNIPQQPMNPNNSQRLMPPPQYLFNIPQQPMNPNHSQRQIPPPQYSLNIPQQAMHPNNSQRQIPSPMYSFSIPQQVMYSNYYQRPISWPQYSFNIPQQVMHPYNSQIQIPCVIQPFNMPQQAMHPNNYQLPCPEQSFNIPQQEMDPNNSQPESPSPQ